MSEVQNLLQAVTAKMDKLAARLDAQKLELEGLLEEKGRLEQELQTRDQHISELVKEQEVLKVARTLSGEAADSSAVKSKINELVREIDKCIALLNR